MNRRSVWIGTLALLLAGCFSCTVWAEGTNSPAFVDGVSISELSSAHYYTGTMGVQDSTSEANAVKPTLVTARTGRKTGVRVQNSSAVQSEATTTEEKRTETSRTTGSVDPSTALLEKQAAEQAAAQALEKQVAEEEAKKTVKARAGETPIGATVTQESTQYTKGSALGIFQITGYYGGTRTYSGTVPTADRTIAADLTVLPLGTKVFINDTVYTVEDIGGSVKGNMIDVYYNTYAEAAGVTALGDRFAEVYMAVPKS